MAAWEWLFIFKFQLPILYHSECFLFSRNMSILSGRWRIWVLSCTYGMMKSILVNNSLLSNARGSSCLVQSSGCWLCIGWRWTACWSIYRHRYDGCNSYNLEAWESKYLFLFVISFILDLLCFTLMNPGVLRWLIDELIDEVLSTALVVTSRSGVVFEMALFGVVKCTSFGPLNGGCTEHSHKLDVEARENCIIIYCGQ